jgi:hypothetical protein
MSATTSTPKLLIALAGLATLGAAWIGLAPAEPEIASERTAAPEHELHARSLSIRAASLATGTSAPCSFLPGARMAYDVRSETTVAIDLGSLQDKVDLGGGGSGVATTPAEAREVQRDWHIELEAVAASVDGSSVLAARIEDRGAQIRGGSAISPSQALSSTFLIRVEPRCAIREFAWRSEGDLEAASEQQILAASLGFWAPKGGSDGIYAGASFDATGRYKAVYEADGQGRVEGEFVEYHANAEGARGPMSVDMTVLSSTIEIELADNAWFESLTNARELELRIADESIGDHARTTVASRTALGSWRPSVDVDDPGWSWGLLLHQHSGEATAHDEALAGVALRDAVASYRALLDTQSSVAESSAYLRGWLRANPEGAGELVELLREGEFSHEQQARAGIFHALGTANTAEAKAALVGIVDGSDDLPAHQISAAHALAAVDQPTPELVELLREQAERDDMHPVERGSMALALGSLAKRSQGQAPEVAAAARSEIRTWLDNPGDDDQLAHSLLAAGNAGHDELADAVAPYIQHEDPQIRSHAAHAMRQMSPEQAYPALEQGLFDDEVTVRTRALESTTAVCRRSDQAPPEVMVELAADWLDGAAAAEERALVEMLGEAARHGSARADQALRARFEQELHSGTNPRRLAALGQNMNGRWLAE